MLCGHLNRKEIKKREDVGIRIADSLTQCYKWVIYINGYIYKCYILLLLLLLSRFSCVRLCATPYIPIKISLINV